MPKSFKKNPRNGPKCCSKKASVNVPLSSFDGTDDAYRSETAAKANSQSKIFSFAAFHVSKSRGSVRLAQSTSGSTVYMEPEPIIELNNLDALLHSQIRHHKQRVLHRLSRKVETILRSFQEILLGGEAIECIGGNDSIFARIGYRLCTGTTRSMVWRRLSSIHRRYYG